MPEQMGWDEAIRAVRTIRSDPSSQLAAAVEGWDYPLDRLGWMVADLLDVQGSAAMGKKWKRYPRPVAANDRRQKWGDTGGRSRDEVVAILNGLGHTLN